MLARRPAGAIPIRVRISIAYAVFLACTISLVGISVVGLLRAQLLREIDNSLCLRSIRIVNDATVAAGSDGVLDAQDARAALADLPLGEALSAPGIYVEILSPPGDVLASSPGLPTPDFRPPPSLIQDAMKGQTGFGEVIVAGDRIRLFVQPITQGGRVVGVVVVGRSLHMLDLTIRRSEQLILAAATGAVVMSIIGGWILTGRTLGPISQITRVARNITRTGRFEQHLPVPRVQDELGELTATLNEMLERIADTLGRQREFLADVSHELRIPLTIIRGNLDLLGANMPDDEREVSIRVVKSEVDRMGRLVSDLLFLAEVDSREMILREEVRLDRLMATIYLRAAGVDNKAHEVILVRNDPVVVLGDSARLEQMVWNLLENARRYTPAGGSIRLSLHSNAEEAEIIVSDSGIGIPSEHLPRIFERFYRVDQTRSRATGGTGLGLAIVRQIVEAHSGEVTVESVVGTGATFRVRLPAFPC